MSLQNRTVTIVLACGLLLVSAFAAEPTRPEDRVLPDFDIRDAAPGRAAVPPGVRGALERLRALSPAGLEARFHPLTGGARLLLVRGAALTAPRSGSPRQIAQEFLAAHHEVFGLSAADLDRLVLEREYSGGNESVVHLTFGQERDGIGVFGGGVRLHVDRAGRIVFASASAVPLAGPAGSPRRSAEEAVLAATAGIRPELSFAPQMRSGPSGSDQASVFDRGPFAQDITARLVLFPVRGGVRLAWKVFLEPEGFPQAYEMLVDAANGQVLHRRNTYNYAEGAGSVLQSNATAALDVRRPDEHPAGGTVSGPSDPPNGCPPVNNHLNRDLNTQFRDNSTVLFNNGRLAGNNVHAYRVSTGTEGALGTLSSGVWNFDFTFNTASAAETNLFFASNFAHDFFYDLGFDEASGNFQEDNFGRGGLGSDSLNANARATGRNNANFSTPSDGFNPTMNMFLWDGLGCWQENVDGDASQDLDGDLDLDIILHEYHHGVSHRLNTSFGGNEAGAMGEGGGDFFAYSVDGDTKLAEYSRPPNGIRQVNTKTYGNWACSPCSVHSNGQIWANTLWDLRERFRTDLVGGSQESGIGEVHQLYINGLKLSPNSPTMLEMRDSMLQDDLVRHPSGDPGGSANYCRMWDEFAGRGMGAIAQDTKDTGASTTVVQDFSVPAACGGPPPVAPNPPSGLAATAVSSSQINLAWTDGSSNEDGFRIERCTGLVAVCDGNPALYAQIAQVGANVASYSNTGLAASSSFSYRVRAFNAAGDSAYSSSDDATTLAAPVLPNAPTSLLATAGSAGNSRFVDLAWTDDSSNEDSFRIERCQPNKQGLCNFAEVASTPPNADATASFRDNSVSRRKKYRYRVRARNAGGDSAYSNTVEVTTP